MRNIREIADAADVIVNGYAYTKDGEITKKIENTWRTNTCRSITNIKYVDTIYIIPHIV